jgi:hypothetical protein
MRLLFAILSLSSCLEAQAIDSAALARLTQDLHSTIQNDSLVSAADIAVKLDDAVQAQRRAWLVRDAGERVDEALSWLPVDIDSFWVNHASPRRALAADLPEWSQVDRTAAFWGLRHHAAESTPSPEERGCESAQLPYLDCKRLASPCASMPRHSAWKCAT